jgi:glycosyltransferase involved in cell wall biosynthesis
MTGSRAGIPDICVIVSTYNRPDALRAVLRSLVDQQCRDFEITVADDGSTRETRELVDEFSLSMSVPISHVWQKDEGFRLSTIRNRAAAATRAPYLVFIDGDCVVRPGFLAAQARLAEERWFLRGSRVMIDERLTREILAGGDGCHHWSRTRWFREWTRGSIDRLLPLLPLPLGPFRSLGGERWKGVKGCSLGVWRSDLIAINGFDEKYVGWGHEDVDFALRLLRFGVRRKEGRFATPVLHLWHPQLQESKENPGRFSEALESVGVRADLGIDQYL